MDNAVRKPSAACAAMAQHWPMIDALIGGTAAMRAVGKTHLPQWPSEPDDAYRARLGTAVLFPAYARTVEVLTGKPFSKPLTLADDVPGRIREWCADVDLQGRDLQAFAAGLCASALSHGIGGILVDFPRAAGATRTVAEERAAGVRPYFVEIKAGDILGWRSQRIAGIETLTQLRFLECVEEPDGVFGEKHVEQVRVLYPGAWQVWRKDEAAAARREEKWVLFEEGTTTLRKIPFVPVYGKRMGFMRAAPPLLDLAFLNIEHWQSKSDQQTILHVARVPILFAKGLGEAGIVVGAGQAVQGDGPDADLKFVEHSGKAIEAGRKDLLDLEDRMRQVGAELLVIKPGRLTVAQTMSENEAGTCALQRIIQDMEDALRVALGLMAEWVGETPAGSANIWQDFGVTGLAEASLTLLREMAGAGQLSTETLFSEAQRRGVIAPENDWPAEKARIAAERAERDAHEEGEEAEEEGEGRPGEHDA